MGTAISETKLMDKWAASKRTQVSAIPCIKLLPLLENALKLNFKAFYETENLDPLQGQGRWKQCSVGAAIYMVCARKFFTIH